MPADAAVIQEILDRIAEGESLRKVCLSPGMPKISSFLRWCSEDEKLADQYARARDVQMDVWAEECLAIADDDSGDFGYRKIKDESGESAEVFINKDNIQRAKIRLDERHWQMSKQRPKKYGEFARNEITGANGGPLQGKITIEFVKPTEAAP